MRSFAILAPVPLAAATVNGAAAGNLLTPDPREAVQAGGAAGDLRIDLGQVRSIDTLFVGFTGAAADARFALRSGIAAPDETVVGTELPFAGSRGDPGDRHGVVLFDAPVQARYLTLALATRISIGVVAAGLAFRPRWPQEIGAGRSVGDTGTRERLRSGGFGIDLGVATTGWQWTLGDLDDDEVDALYAIARDQRQTRSVLVVESVEQSAGLNERLHWGMFDRLEAYERRGGGKTRWAFRIEDWG